VPSTRAKLCGVSSSTSYSAEEGTYCFCRKLLALPYLPASTIDAVFTRLEVSASSTKLQQLTEYVKDNWIASETWPPATWSVYCQPVCTNNDAEGWHHRLNGKAQQSGFNMYLLISLLAHKAAMVTNNAKLLSDKKVRRSQLKSTVIMQAKLNAYWELGRVPGRHTVCESAAECMCALVCSAATATGVDLCGQNL